MLQSHRDYREILMQELAGRCQRNPSYSLRAFARDLKLASSRVSEILNGKQGLSLDKAETIARTLGFAKKETEYFCCLVEAKHARSRSKRALAEMKVKQHQMDYKFQQVQIDTFDLISKWYHYGILELGQTSCFRSDPTWIAAKLGVSVPEIKTAIDRLLRLGMLGSKNGSLIVKTPFTSTPTDIPSAAIKQFHEEILGKAITSLHTQEVTKRDVSAIVMSIDPSQMDLAKDALRKFRRRFCRQLQKSKKKSKVYCLSIQFFDLGTKETSS
jgi:uncharacterized protein (TIGR02147 family)